MIVLKLSGIQNTLKIIFIKKPCKCLVQCTMYTYCYVFNSFSEGEIYLILKRKLLNSWVDKIIKVVCYFV